MGFWLCMANNHKYDFFKIWPWKSKVKVMGEGNVESHKVCVTSYLRNGRANWHGTKGMWVDSILHPLCDFQLWPQPWPWPWIFEVKFWKSRISGMGWMIDMGWKGCESIKCWTHVATFNFPLTHDLVLIFSRSNSEKVLSYEWDGRLTWNKRDVSQ